MPLRELIDPSSFPALKPEFAMRRPAEGLLDPLGHPPRILLLVHGTFSSTIGGFGQLGGTPAGKKLLGSPKDRYDVGLGYDHLTLSVDRTRTRGGQVLEVFPQGYGVFVIAAIAGSFSSFLFSRDSR